MVERPDGVWTLDSVRNLACNLCRRVNLQEINNELKKKMNFCMRATFKCIWDDMIARLESTMASISAAHTDWTVAKESDESLIFLANITDFAALSEPMMNEDQVQWDRANGVEYVAYTMQPMGR